jgi:hypothetical protein
MKVIGIGGYTAHSEAQGVERDVRDSSTDRRDNSALARQTSIQGYWR